MSIQQTSGETTGPVPTPASSPFAARETSAATTAGLLDYVRHRAGVAAVDEVLRRAGIACTSAELADPAAWTSYDARIRLFAAATEVLADPTTMFQVGATALSRGLAPSVVLVVRAAGSPRQVFRQLPSAVLKFSTTSTMAVLESGATHATVSLTLREGYRHSRLDCQYAQGLLTSVPEVFGLPPAQIVHDECESDGHPTCLYHLTWEAYSRLPWRRRRQTAADLQLTALRNQLRALQSAATDLVSDDLSTVLQRMVERAAEAVLAPAYLLAVHPPAGGSPLVYSSGLPAGEAEQLAARLLDGTDLGSSAVVVDVASARRSHGRLAALYHSEAPGLGDEQAVLAAYAGHAAAALDLLMALEESRLQADRAGALLELAHLLAASADAEEVCAVVAETLPRVVGCSSASVLLWDPATATLQGQALSRMGDEQQAFFRGARLQAGATPELVGMLTDGEPRVLREADSSPDLRRLLHELGLTDVVAVPLLAGGVFLGVAAGNWSSGQAPDRLDGEVVARLRGVADQAATALERARLLETVRHQATHDALTGLPNRTLFSERLADSLAHAGPNAPLAVLFCDLDRFKQVNDTLGHDMGDELLRQVAVRLRAVVRPGDTVARLSGDEFALVLPEVADRTDAERLADRVAACFEAPFPLDGHEVLVGASVGVAVHVAAAGDAVGEDLLRQADAAMYQDKGRRRLPV